MQFTAAITHEDPLYVARCVGVEVASQGETVEEALANLKEAVELYFEDEALPEELEPPSHCDIAPVCVSPALPVVSGADHRSDSCQGGI